MKKTLWFVLASVLTLALAGVATAHPPKPSVLPVSNAPVAPDGTTASAITDFVITVVNRNPSINGLDLKEGATIEIVLPKGFTNVGEGANTAILLQGWPQSPPAPPPAFPWTLAVDGNKLTVTFTGAFGPGELGPGMKQIHLLLNGFRNPDEAGKYSIDVAITPDPAAKVTMNHTSVVKILPRVRPSIHALALFSGPPGPPPPFFNPIYQTVTQGEAARQVGFYLWNWGGEAFIGVDLVMDTATHGLLVKDKQTVGYVKIRAPKGASGFTFETLDAVVADGTPAGPSELLEAAFLTGVPVGKLLTRFAPDPNITGKYEIMIRLRGGNVEWLFVDVVSPPKAS